MLLTFRGTLSVVVCAFALISGAGCGGGSSSTTEPQDFPVGGIFRSVAAVSTADARYSRKESQVINSQAALDQFIAGLDRNDGLGPASESDPLVISLRASNVNFDQEALVVLEKTSGGGPILVSLDPPQLQGKTFVSTIRTTETDGGGAAVISYNFYVFAVSRARVDDVRVAIVPTGNADGTPQTIRLTVPDR